MSPKIVPCASVLSLGGRLGAALEMAQSLGAAVFAKSRGFRRNRDRISQCCSDIIQT
jgi:hypothetical protein